MNIISNLLSYACWFSCYTIYISRGWNVCLLLMTLQDKIREWLIYVRSESNSLPNNCWVASFLSLLLFHLYTDHTYPHIFRSRFFNLYDICVKFKTYLNAGNYISFCDGSIPSLWNYIDLFHYLTIKWS